MPRPIHRLITSGIIPLEGDEALIVKMYFGVLVNMLPDNSELPRLPAVIRVDPTPTRHRRGFICNQDNIEMLNLNSMLAGIMGMAHTALRNIADSWFVEICNVYGIEYSSVRDINVLDSLGVVRYMESNFARAAHRDLSLLTIGMSNGEGLELETSPGVWTLMPPFTPYIHTGLFLHKILVGVPGVNPAFHRVTGTRDGRVFMGMFYDPTIGWLVKNKCIDATGE